jgi:hypothetical protein
MTHDDDLEGTLRRYRPRAPGADLRSRILAAGEADAGRSRFEWIWGPAAAAAILVLWFAAHASQIEPEPDPLRDAEVAVIAEILGGGEDAIAYAELAVPRRNMSVPIPLAMEDAW